MEEGGVQFATEQEAAVVVPVERWAIVAAIGYERLMSPGGVGQLKDARQQPFANCLGGAPWSWLVEALWRQHRDLLRDEKIEMGSAHFESGGVVANETRQQRREERCIFGVRPPHGEVVADGRDWKHPTNHRSLIRTVGDVPPTHQPSRGAAGQGLLREGRCLIFAP